MRKGLLIAALMGILANSVRAQMPTFQTPLPGADNLSTLRFGSDLSYFGTPLNPTDNWPLTRLKLMGPGSQEAPRSYTGYGLVEWIRWWTRDQSPPTLWTQPEGRSVGDGELGYDSQERNGVRVTLGWWLNNVQTLALETSYFSLCKRSPALVAGPQISRPFVNADTGRADSEAALVARAQNLSRLWGAEINGRAELARWTGGHLDLIVGVRHLQLSEDLDLAAVGIDAVVTRDRFGSHNQFWGGQIGFDGQLNWGPLSLDLYGKLGLGVNHQVVDVEGTRILDDQSAQGGFFAQLSNQGRHVRDPFALAPEVGVHLAYRLTDNIRVTAGYSILWLTETWRPGDQIDVQLSRTPGANRPSFLAKDSIFWAQGINVGLELRW